MTPPERSGRLARLVDSRAFNSGIALVIVVNAIVLGLETYPGLVSAHGELLALVNSVCYLVFVAELAIRFASYGRRPADFFKNAESDHGDAGDVEPA